MSSASAPDAGSGLTPPPVEEMAALKVEVPETNKAEEVPPHRSHDPSNNAKRTDPFQFGSRYLEAGDDIFEYNAWDHVETDDAYKENAEKQFAMQRQNPVSEFDKCESTVPSYFFLLLSLPTRCKTCNGCSFHDDTQPMHSSSET